MDSKWQLLSGCSNDPNVAKGLSRSLGLFPPPFTSSDAVVGMSALPFPSPREQGRGKSFEAAGEIQSCNLQPPRERRISTIHAKGDGDDIISGARLSFKKAI